MKDNPILMAGRPASTLPPSQSRVLQRILTVDDDVSLRRLNLEVLSSSGYEVDVAEDGAAAWEALNTDSYDLMITDNNMPRLTGIELLKKLRSARMALPVIMATGQLPEDEFTQYPWLRPAATLLKPYSVPELLGAVKMVLREAETVADRPRLFKDRDPKVRQFAQVESPASVPRQRPTNSPRRILVVDDDRDTRQLSVDVLVGSGYDVDAVTDGAAGWEALQSTRYDLTITDNKMPRMTGIEMIEKLRSARITSPVIMATRQLPMDEFARRPWLKPDATLQRPFSNDDLLETVKSVLGSDDHNDDREAALRPKHF